ncbi:threonine aldolase family protein [Aestuariivivens sediminicola]|uniref:threonine aldolase family protein n=1 Tax=Aestuariivivens sediminicola TaxID=2913560 RepID=UPI001F5801AF|nr:GntG family PLP-dependent aldolase [Aestuariivivens sediminicola]
MTIDLRSDTVTKPSTEMLNAMMAAKVGDDVFREDPTVRELEERVAALFGMDRALFFPSGTMANQTAIKLHTQPGEQLICDKYAHVYNYESGGLSFNSGVSCKLIDGEKGMFTAKQVSDAINPSEYWYAKTSMVEIENTTNKGGGACWDFQEILNIKEVCNRHDLRFHLDGARIWNALVAKNESARQYGDIFDSISVCFSKGLGCPVGSILLGDEVKMQQALRIRKVFGGNMRQAGYLAAAALFALDNNMERLEEDHRKAKEIGAVLGRLPVVKSIDPIETNIVIFELKDTIDELEFIKLLDSQNVQIIAMGGGKLRMVTHLDYTQTMHERLLAILSSITFDD